MAARKLCEHLKVNFDGEEFVVGLLHDVGKLVLDLVAHEEMSRAIAATHETGISMRHAEQEVFGVDHAEVSGWMCQRWNLPEDLVDAVRFHHDPGKAEFNRMLAAVVYLADGIARVAGNGFGGETTPITIEETDAWRILAPKVPPDIDLAFLYFEIQDTMARHSGLLTGGNG